MSQAGSSGQQPSESTKKRKATEFRSQVEDHFEKVLNCHMLSCLKNPYSVRKALAKMVIFDELRFKFLKERGFKQFIELACPMFKIPSRQTVNRDIFGIFTEERANLKKLLKENTQRISLTIDTWTSVQKINYMCITAYFIDVEWRLNKKIISFVPIHLHKGESIANALECCLVDWGINNIATITLDNAFSNDVAIGLLRSKLVSWGCSSGRAPYLHIRCIANILNLVVQDGLKMAHSSVKKLRDCVRWVRGSPSRLTKFRELANLLGVEEKGSLCLDVPTRWNSTYMMLQTAIVYRTVFETYDGHDASFKLDLGDSVLSCIDWESLESFVIHLETFYEMTVRISSSLYVTSNSYLSEITDLSWILAKMRQSPSKTEQNMGKTMKEKFDRYWGDPEKMNFVIFLATILDPRDKVEYMPFQLNQLYGEDQGEECFKKVKSKLTSLFEDYVTEYPSSDSKPSMVVNSQPDKCENIPIGRVRSRLKSLIMKQKIESGVLLNKKSELEVYLSEPIVDDSNDLDVLRWWKLNSQRFPILSKVARDVLAVPISTISSESTFSTSGRLLNNFRSSLTPEMVEALVCTQDWLRANCG